MNSISPTEPSVDELRRQAERTRAGLTGTVEELRTRVTDTAAEIRERVSPAAIKAEVKEYVRVSGEQFFHKLERKARDNPLQAVAIGAGLAYPLLNILRSMPAPIMLIGAGILLARPMKGDTMNQAKQVASDAVGTVRDRARDASDAVQRGVEQAGDGASRALHDAQDRFRQVVDPLTSKASDAAASIKSTITGAVADASSVVQEAGTSAYKTGSEALNSATEQATELGRKAKDTLSDAFERNPLVVAGIGLAIGAFIASSLPVSDTENRVFGETSDDLKERAQRAAASGVEAAKDLAGNVSSAAASQGVSVDGLAAAADGLTEKVRAVADRGLKAALGNDKQTTTQNSPSTGTRTPHERPL